MRIDSTNPLQLAAFLATVRAYIEQTGPGLTRWDTLKYKEQGYVRISPVKGQPGMPSEIENMAIYYTTAGGALTVTLNEGVLKRAIDRGLSRAARDSGQPTANGAKPQAAVAATPRKWLGSNVGLHVDARILEVANALAREQYQDRMQVLMLEQSADPERVEAALSRPRSGGRSSAVWGVTLVCPGGGKYVWNEKFGTMESTVYGHPGQPKAGPPAPPVLSSFTSADFGLTLENEGLRARVELQRPAK